MFDIPKYLLDEIDLTRKLEWNDVPVGASVVVIREEIANVYHKKVKNTFYMGKISQMERLRNCVMLNLGGGYRFEEGGINTNPQRDYQTHRWKKAPGSAVYAWNETLVNSRPGRMSQAKFKGIFSNLDANAEKRRTYVHHRNVLGEARHRVETCFSILGMTTDASVEDFKSVRRSIMVDWHPDRLAVFLHKGKGTAEDFYKNSKKMTDALAEVGEYIQRRDDIMSQFKS